MSNEAKTTDGPPYAETDPRHHSFTSGTLSRRPACPSCLCAMDFGMAGNWWCRPCTREKIEKERANADRERKNTVPLARLAAEMGMTEDQLKAWIVDTPRRQRDAMERISRSPQYRAALDRLFARAKERANG